MTKKNEEEYASLPQNELDAPIYRLTFMRWIQLMNLIFLTITQYIGYISTSPVGYQIHDYYNVELTLVNFLPSMCALVQIFAGIPVSIAVEKYGSSRVILVASVLNTVGLSIKCLINVSFWYSILG